VGNPYCDRRLEALRTFQNEDGGWTHLSGSEANRSRLTQSWLEPTVYAALALHGEPAADRAWTLLKSWQQPDGSWRPSANVQVPAWGTALGVTLAAIRGDSSDVVQKGVRALVENSGVDAGWFRRAAQKIGGLTADPDKNLAGWPWTAASASSVEPSAHALLALKKASSFARTPALLARIRQGENQLLDVQTDDGGWNYGSSSISNGVLHGVLDVTDASYPETTALALIGLQGTTGLSMQIDRARRWYSETRSPLARALLTIALRVHGNEVELPVDADGEKLSRDISIVALQSLAGSESHWELFRVGSVPSPGAHNGRTTEVMA
jgi:hypothetical protein